MIQVTRTKIERVTVQNGSTTLVQAKLGSNVVRVVQSASPVPVGGTLNSIDGGNF